MDENTVLPVSALTDNHYGLEDICLGLPSIIGSSGIKKTLEIPLDVNELNLLNTSARKIKAIVDSINFAHIV